jgi:hypothetical protein
MAALTTVIGGKRFVRLEIHWVAPDDIAWVSDAAGVRGPEGEWVSAPTSTGFRSEVCFSNGRTLLLFMQPDEVMAALRAMVAP